MRAVSGMHQPQRAVVGLLFLAFATLAACTVGLEARNPWPCSGDDDCDAIHICTRSADGRFCRQSQPRCAGPNCGLDEPGIVVGDEPPVPPDMGVPPDGAPPPPDALVADSAPLVDGGPEPDAKAPEEPDAAAPRPTECPNRGVNPEALETFVEGYLCDQEDDLCAYEFSSSEPASCNDLCALFDLTCFGAGYNPTRFWCLGPDPRIEFGCSDTDVRGMWCVCQL